MKIHFPRKDRKIISWAVVIMAYFEDADFPEDDDGSVNGVDIITVPLVRSQTAAWHDVDVYMTAIVKRVEGER